MTAAQGEFTFERIAALEAENERLRQALELAWFNDDSEAGRTMKFPEWLENKLGQVKAATSPAPVSGEKE